jgi:hypothetical protein
MSEPKIIEDLVEKCDYDTKLAVTAWVFEKIMEHANNPGSFRYLIYDRLGFGPDAYVPLYNAGGMEITNEFDLTQKDTVLEIVQKEKIEALKPVLGLCDEPGCFEVSSCGFPVEGGGYRRTCYSHMEKKDDRH